MTASARTTVHLRIEGRVQGVGYRFWTERMAEELGLEGWVRNRRDGSVEAVFQGASGAVAQMVELCREGPAEARVTEVEVLGEGADAFTGFEVRKTA